MAIFQTVVGGSDTSDANAAPADIRSGKSAYVNGTKIIGTMGNATVATPETSISPGAATGSVATSTGIVTITTAKATKSVTPSVTTAGYISSTEGTKTAGTITVPQTSNTYQLPTVQAATIYNTSTSDRTISAGTYLTDTQTIKAVTTSNVSAAKIASGTIAKVGDANDAGRIVNVTGTFTSSSTVSSGQTAADASKIASGYSAWVNGAEVKGTAALTEDVDWVIDYGTGGAHAYAQSGYFWYYRKWNSGKLEYFISNNYASASTARVNAGICSAATNRTFNIQYPYSQDSTNPKFVDVPMVTIIPRGACATGLSTTLTAITASSVTFTIYTYYAGDTTTGVYYIDLYAVGRWV